MSDATCWNFAIPMYRFCNSCIIKHIRLGYIILVVVVKPVKKAIFLSFYAHTGISSMAVFQSSLINYTTGAYFYMKSPQGYAMLRYSMRRQDRRWFWRLSVCGRRNAPTDAFFLLPTPEAVRIAHRACKIPLPAGLSCANYRPFCFPKTATPEYPAHASHAFVSPSKIPPCRHP